jgi:hypothetical protein
VPHVNQLVDKFGKRGFVALYVTDGPEAETKKFIEDSKCKCPVVWEKPLASMDKLGFDGYPASALVGPDGKVLWTGHPAGLTEKIIEHNLKGVTLGPPPDKLMADCELPKKYAATAKLLASGKIGEGRTALTTALAAKDVKPEDKPQLEAAAADVDKLIEDEMKAADTAFTEKRYFDAQADWKRVSAACRPLEAQKTADQKLADLAKDASLKKEIEAGQRIAEAQKLVAAGKTAPAISMLNGISDGYLKDTEEAKRAKQLADDLKKPESRPG